MKLKTCEESRSFPTRSLRSKAYQSITGPFTGDPELVGQLDPMIRKCVRALIKQLDYPKRSIAGVTYEPLLALPFNDKHRFVIWVRSDGKFNITSLPHTDLGIYNVQTVLSHPRIQDIYDLNPGEFISRCFTGSTDPDARLESLPERRVEFPLQEVDFLSQWSDKDRTVTRPTAIMQCLTKPLGATLGSINKKWKVQGVNSHLHAQEELRRKLHENQYTDSRQKFYSFDLSDFTDRFPYTVQRIVLDELLQLEVIDIMDIESMDLVCSAQTIFEKSIIRYAVGTPMGTYPSFPLASMAHGIIATISYVASHHLSFDGVDLNRLPFKVIGDDFVCWDDQLSTTYTSIMEGLGLEIQRQKCMTSPTCVNICSKIVTCDDIYEQKKLKRHLARNLFQAIENCRYYGESYLDNYDESIQVVVKALMKVPEPYGLWDPTTGDPLPEWEETIYKSLRIGHQLSKWSLDTISQGDIEILYQRKGEFPAIEHGNRTWERNEQARHYILDVIRSEILDLVHEVKDPRRNLTLSQRVEKADLVAKKYDLFRGLSEWCGIKLDNPPTRDYHFRPIDEKKSSLIRYLDSARLYALMHIQESNDAAINITR